MKTRVAMYGLGRLGRSVYAVLSRRHDVEIVMVASDESPEAIVDALVSDAIYASLEEAISPAEGGFQHREQHVNVRPVRTESVWSGHDIDIVIDTLTAEPTKKTLLKHQNAGAKRVVFAAPSADFPAAILGSTEDVIKEPGDAITVGGAVEAAAAPVRDILAGVFSVEHSIATTVDGVVGCAGAGSCDCGDTCECESGCSCCSADTARVPAPSLVASMTELICQTKRAVTAEAVNGALEKAAKAPYYQGIVAVAKDPISSDGVIGESVSAVIDASRTVADGRLVSVKIWYDREWGYANRIAELTADYGKMKGKKHE